MVSQAAPKERGRGCDRAQRLLRGKKREITTMLAGVGITKQLKLSLSTTSRDRGSWKGCYTQ